MLNVVPNPANQSLGNSRDLIKNNFGDIDTTFTVNHVQYNDGSGNQGFHQFINLPSGTPIGATNNGTAQVALYSNVGISSTVPELFFQRNNLAANNGYAFTEGNNAAVGYSRLPSGLLMKWGSFTALSGVPSGNTFSFPTTDGSGHTIPAFTIAPFQIQISTTATASSHSSSVYIYADTPATATQFTVYNQGTNSKLFYYFAIGI